MDHVHTLREIGAEIAGRVIEHNESCLEQIIERLEQLVEEALQRNAKNPTV